MRFLYCKLGCLPDVHSIYSYRGGLATSIGGIAEHITIELIQIETWFTTCQRKAKDKSANKANVSRNRQD